MAATQSQQMLETVAAEDIIGNGPELGELRKALAIVVDENIVATAQKLARAKSAIKDLLPNDGKDRTILVDENFIITEKHGERSKMSSDPKTKVPSVRRSYKPTG